jgi:hypothetical protein
MTCDRLEYETAPVDDSRWRWPCPELPQGDLVSVGGISSHQPSSAPIAGASSDGGNRAVGVLGWWSPDRRAFSADRLLRVDA